MNSTSQGKVPVSVVNFGTYAEIAENAVNGTRGKRFLSNPLGTTGCEVSLNRILAGRGLAYSHKHRRNEEVYIVVSGRGVFYADDVRHELKEGTVLRLSPGVARTLEAAPDSHLDYICVQAVEGSIDESFFKDGIPLPLQVPIKNPLPIPAKLQAFFDAQAKTK